VTVAKLNAARAGMRSANSQKSAHADTSIDAGALQWEREVARHVYGTLGRQLRQTNVVSKRVKSQKDTARQVSRIRRRLAICGAAPSRERDQRLPPDAYSFI